MKKMSHVLMMTWTPSLEMAETQNVYKPLLTIEHLLSMALSLKFTRTERMKTRAPTSRD